MKPLMNVTSATVKTAAHGVPRSGQIIADRYKLDRELERGAMGSVWRAEQVRLRAPVAIKFLDPSLFGDKEMHDRFIQEARSAAAVRSAHVVQVFDYGTEDGLPYIAMELLDGENLDTRLGTRGTLSPAELAKLFTEVSRGIGQAHAIGVIHRDLKPGNIFIAREGEHEVTKIVDFGIAKVKASALRLTQGIGTQLGTLLGTPQYMSPEQVRGSSSIDHRTDLWALAVIACECLTGHSPFSGATIGDLTVQICTERPPAPSSFGAVPAGFDQWFFKATQKKQNKRFQSVEEMAERLHAVLGPAILATAGVARAGRLITFPSRSEVRLAYTAVVTWKGYVLNRLGQRWFELRRLMMRIGRYLAIQWEVVHQRLSELLESERLAFMRPIVERHGTLASVALLCCGIVLLGLTARSSDPPPVSAAPQQASAAVPTPVSPSAEGSLEPNPAAADAVRAQLEAPSAPAVAVSERDVVPAAAAETEAMNDPREPRAPEPRAVPRSRSRDLRAKSAAESGPPSAPKPAAVNVDSAAGSKKATPAKTPATKAAPKILDADELLASAAAKKLAPSAAQRPARPAKSIAGQGKSNPFDDRL